MTFALIFEALQAPTPSKKLALIRAIEQSSQVLLESASSLIDSPSSEHIFSDIHSPIYPHKTPSYSGFCTIIHPAKIRRPKHIASKQSLAKLLHSIVHIEYSAIDLALDAMYRFRHLPLKYYCDWLIVALQEAHHFELLEQSLRALGYEYGDFAVHSQLFQAQVATQQFDERMALLHRGLEANGLDANPFVAAKVKAFQHDITPQILQTLELILHDEIEHVQKGDFWWRYANAKASSQDFLRILNKYKHLYTLPKILNTQARLQAGFNDHELKLMANP